MQSFQEILKEVRKNFPGIEEKEAIIRARENYIFQNYDKQDKKKRTLYLKNNVT